MTDRPWRVQNGTLLLRVRATPRAGRDTLEGMRSTARGIALEARVRAAPEAGEANAAIERLLARWLGVPKTHVGVTDGATSRIKTVAVAGDARLLETLVAAKVRELGT